jgi:hypothetical protein
MGLLDHFGGPRMKHPVRGTAQVVSCSSPRGTGLMDNCHMKLVVRADDVPAKAIEHTDEVDRQHWPSPGVTLPVTVDRDDPARLKVEWDETQSSSERADAAAESLASVLGPPSRSAAAP